MRFFVILSLIFNSQMVSFAKQDKNFSGQAKVQRQLAEEKDIQQFVDIWNNSENTKMLLQKFNIEPEQLKRLENDLQSDKILMQKPPQLEYWPQNKVLWMNFEEGREKLLFVNRESPNQLPTIYSGFQFLQIQKNQNMVDSYIQFKKQLKDSLREQMQLENSWSNKKAKKVSSFNIIFSLLNEETFADVISVPFTGKKKEKTNWTVWIALGSLFGAFALYKGGEYLYKNYVDKPAQAVANPAGNSGESAKASGETGGDSAKDLAGSEGAVAGTVAASVNANSTVAGDAQTVNAPPAGAADDAQGENADSALTGGEAGKPIATQALDPMVEIEKNLKKLQVQEKLFIRQLLCASNQGTVFKVERIGSEPLETYGVSSEHPNNIAITVLSGEEEKDCYYNYKSAKFTSKNQYCPTGIDRQLIFSQEETFKHLQEQVKTCCGDLNCKGNLLNLVGADIKRFDPSARPIINGNSVK